MDILPDALKPNWITTVEVEFKTTVIEFENGTEQRLANWKYGKKRYSFNWNLMTNSELAALENFFNLQCGQAESWKIVDDRISSNPTTLRFNSDKLKIDKVNSRLSNVTIEVKEC